MLLGLAPGVVGLRAGLGGPLLRGRGALLGLGDQLLRRRLRRRQALGLLALRFLAAGGELDLELGLGLRPLGLALLQDALRLAAHLVRLPLGGGEDLVALPLGRPLELGDLPLGGGAELGDVALYRGPLLRYLVVGYGAELGGLALGGGGQLVGLTACPGADRVGFPLGGAAQVVGLPLGAGAQLGRLVLGTGTVLGRVHLGGGLQFVGRGAGFPDDLRRLLLGEAEQLLDAGTEARVRGPLLLAELAVRLGQLLLQCPDLLAVLADLQIGLLEVLVDLVLVISAHDLGEVAGRDVFEEIAELSVDFRLHVA